MGGAMLPPPDGVWGMPPEMVKTIIGYDNVAANREKARELMKEAGYGPDKRLKVKVSTRNIATFRDPATILIDHLKHIYVDGELEVIDTSIYYNRVFKKDYVVALNLTGSAVDDPDVTFFEGYACGSLRNYNNYCDPEMTKLFEAQSREVDHEKRLKMVWDIDRKLQEDDRPTHHLCTTAPPAAGSPTSRAWSCTATASTTARASRTCGWTSSSCWAARHSVARHESSGPRASGSLMRRRATGVARPQTKA